MANLPQDPAPHHVDEVDDDDPGFAPRHPNDGREPGEWRTRYEKAARRKIRVEALYVLAVMMILPVATLLVWLEVPNDHIFDVSAERYEIFALHVYAVIGGILGGTVFDLKWLYHSVAKDLWNEDRRLWRLFTPIISGALAFVIVLLATSGLIPLIDEAEIRQPPTAMGLAFIVGYFSDNTLGAMAVVASSILGDHRESDED